MAEAGLGIAAVERDTGIGKETLRVWERRYGFPEPTRDAAGERLYPPEQVQRLRLVKRLLDAGHRPGRVVTAPLAELAALLKPAVPAPSVSPAAPEVQAALARLLAHDADGLRRVLTQALARRGLGGGIVSVIAPLAAQVSERLVQGELQLFEERLFSECAQRVLHPARQALPPAAEGPRVLLTTLPGDGDALGLLMVEALLGLEAATCVPMGAQLPLAQVAPAAAAHRADVVALAWGAGAGRAAADSPAALRDRLPAAVEIWACSSGRPLRLAAAPAGVRVLDGLAAVTEEVTRWRNF